MLVGAGLYHLLSASRPGASEPAPPHSEASPAPEPAQRALTAIDLDVAVDAEINIEPAPAPAGAFRSCREAWAAGAAPIRRGEPGYGAHLDRDQDGVACEIPPESRRTSPQPQRRP